MTPRNLICLFALGILLTSGCHIQYSDGYSFDYSGVKVNKYISSPISSTVKTLSIENQFGNVQVVHDSSASIEWNWDATVWADDAELAKLFLDELEMVETVDEGQVSLSIVLPERSNSLNGIQSNLIINVPQFVQVTTTNSHGDTFVAGLEGDSQITNSHGDVSVQNAGTIYIDSAHGDVVLTNSLGDATINNSHGRVNLSNTQSVTVDCRHTDINVVNSLGDVQVGTTHGDIDLSNIRGSLIVSNQHGDVNANRVIGQIDISTTHADIFVKGDANSLTLCNRHGEIKAELMNENFESIVMETTHDDIILTLPKHSQISLQADKEDTSSELESVEGGTPVILDTSHGSISVRKAK